MNDQNNTSLNIKLKSISPIFIGSGEILSRAEISFKNEFLYIANLNEICKNADIEKLKGLVYNAIAEKDSDLSELDSIIQQNYLYKVATAPNIKEISMGLNESIKTNNQLFIPGSSIKGAILTAVINKALDELILQTKFFLNFIRKIVSGPSFKKKHDIIELNSSLIGIGILWLQKKEKIFEEYNNIEKILNDAKRCRLNQWIQVTDSNLVQIEKYGLICYLKRRGEDIELPDPILTELIRKNTQFEFEINLLNKNQKVTLKEILEIVDEFYTDLYLEEEKWLEKLGLKPFKLEKRENEYLIRIGFGSGNQSMSIIPTIKKIDENKDLFNNLEEVNLLDEYGKKWKLTKSGEARAKTKWLAICNIDNDIYYSPLGWAKIIVSESK